jgi:hypothetical protein
MDVAEAINGLAGQMGGGGKQGPELGLFHQVEGLADDAHSRSDPRVIPANLLPPIKRLGRSFAMRSRYSVDVII